MKPGEFTIEDFNFIKVVGLSPDEKKSQMLQKPVFKECHLYFCLDEIKLMNDTVIEEKECTTIIFKDGSMALVVVSMEEMVNLHQVALQNNESDDLKKNAEMLGGIMGNVIDKFKDDINDNNKEE